MVGTERPCLWRALWELSFPWEICIGSGRETGWITGTGDELHIPAMIQRLNSHGLVAKEKRALVRKASKQ